MLILIMVASVEVACALGYWSGLLLRYPIYRSGNWLCDDCSPIKWKYHPHLGWDHEPATRPTPRDFAPICGAAYGDFFTLADEVEDQDAWPFVLSSLLNCKIENFGVGGYGQDQAYLKYLLRKPPGDIVIIGLYSEMIRRNHAASWRYFAGMTPSLPKPMFRLVEGALVLEKNPQRTDSEAIMNHHKFDRFAAPYKVEFPYLLSLLRVLYYRLFSEEFFKNRLLRDYEWKTSDGLELSKEILIAFVSDVQNSGKSPVVLLLPRPEWVATGHRPYHGYLEWMVSAFPGVCVIDPFPYLEHMSGAETALRAPRGHFNKEGNAVIAQAIFRELNGRCWAKGFAQPPAIRRPSGAP